MKQIDDQSTRPSINFANANLLIRDTLPSRDNVTKMLTKAYVRNLKTFKSNVGSLKANVENIGRIEPVTFNLTHLMK